MKNPEAARRAKAGLSGPASAGTRATAGALITRRGFFGRLFGAATAALVAPYLPTPAPMLAFRRSAFHDATTGIAIRFVQQYDVSRVEPVNRLDVLYGAGYFREPIMCRIEGA